MLESLFTRLARAVSGENSSFADFGKRSPDRESPRLQGACLRYARVCGAALGGADFRGADLRNADLSDATVDHRTDFRAANLCAANLRVDEHSGRRLAAARFNSKTIYDAETRFPNGFDPEENGLTLVTNELVEAESALEACAPV